MKHRYSCVWTIPLSRGQVALIDEQDYARVSPMKWFFIPKNWGVGYAAHIDHVDGHSRITQLHRYIVSANGQNVVDHINNNGLDNRRCNLRICSQRQNSQWKRIGVRNTSGYKGVSFHIHQRKWIATIAVYRKNRYLGAFRSAEEAARVYDAAARKLFGEFARLNFA